MNQLCHKVIKLVIVALLVGTLQAHADTSALWSPDVDWMLNPILVA